MAVLEHDTAAAVEPPLPPHQGDDFDDKQAERIEGHLKKKARAREKVTLEYKGDFRFVRWEFFSRPLPTKVLFVQEIKRPIAGLCIVP